MAIVRLLEQLDYEDSVGGVRERLRQVAASAPDSVRVAVLRDEVVGFYSLHVMLYFHEGVRMGRVSALVVDRAHRGQGIGRQLMDDAERLAREQGCSKIEVASALRRTEAHAFYERLGYEHVAHRFVKGLESN